MSNKEHIKAFAAHIDKLRSDRNLSYGELAEACGMEKMQLYNICKKGIDLRLSSIERLAKGLNVTICELITFKKNISYICK